MLEKLKRQSRLDTPERLVTSGTQDAGRKQQQKNTAKLQLSTIDQIDAYEILRFQSEIKTDISPSEIKE